MIKLQSYKLQYYDDDRRVLLFPKWIRNKHNRQNGCPRKNCLIKFYSTILEYYFANMILNRRREVQYVLYTIYEYIIYY